MLGINFGSWNSSHKAMFNWYRIYCNYKWTPLIWGMPRYNTLLQKHYKEEEINENK